MAKVIVPKTLFRGARAVRSLLFYAYYLPLYEQQISLFFPYQGRIRPSVSIQAFEYHTHHQKKKYDTYDIELLLVAFFIKCRLGLPPNREGRREFGLTYYRLRGPTFTCPVPQPPTDE